ncbi:MAG: circularly permuted type 2 ATP-grasp protein [Pirellulales bacterium]
MSSATAPFAAAATEPPLFGGYPSQSSHFDELLSSPGAIRAPWRRFVDSLQRVGRSEFSRRWDISRRMLRDNGVTYNVHGDPEGRDRPWELDPVPLILGPEEWETLSQALTQRARLLNLVLADLYGPQRLLHEGVLPPEAVFANRLFLRACWNIPVPNQTFVQFYAAHVARNPSGEWVLLADRTQAPAGAGYAVENRILLSRMIPDTYQDCGVQRLAGFFLSVRESLSALAPKHRENPRIVLLSPGPQSPAYFEDAYLSRYLGFTLVEGGDLTVRDNRVYLKTLGGLIPVDVIMRRVADADCDPLELSSRSMIGVPGLNQAVRAGNVAIANPLGSNLLEAPIFMAFWSKLARHYFGEDLKLRSAATWWCGDSTSLRYVYDNLEKLLIRPAFAPRGDTIQPLQLSASARQELLAKIAKHPAQYVAQERIDRSTVPVWSNGEILPWRMGLRAFLMASKDGYQVMPGGLVRVTQTDRHMAESTLAGQGSKDVWVLSEGPVKPVTLLHPAGEPLNLLRSGNDLPSRVADNMYWLGRNVERAEGGVRLVRCAIARLLGETGSGDQPELSALVRALTGQGQLRPEFAAQDSGGFRSSVMETELLAFVFDEKHLGGLRNTLGAVRDLSNGVRDRISIDSWRILNMLTRENGTDAYPLGVVRIGDVLDSINHMLVTLSAFSGLGTESMTRGPAWRFLDIGRRLERTTTPWA